MPCCPRMADVEMELVGMMQTNWAGGRKRRSGRLARPFTFLFTARSTTALRGSGGSEGTPGRHRRAGARRLEKRLQPFGIDRKRARGRRAGAARELAAADGATFVLREGDQCHYAERVLAHGPPAGRQVPRGHDAARARG